MQYIRVTFRQAYLLQEVKKATCDLGRHFHVDEILDPVLRRVALYHLVRKNLLIVSQRGFITINPMYYALVVWPAIEELQVL